MVDNVRYLQSQPSMFNVEGWLSNGAMVVVAKFLFVEMGYQTFLTIIFG